jgi:hypothetical protein
MVAELSKRIKLPGNTHDIDVEIEFTRLKIIYILKNDPHNFRILRIAFNRFAWLLFNRQFDHNFLSKEAARAFETMELFLNLAIPACPGEKTTRI